MRKNYLKYGIGIWIVIMVLGLSFTAAFFLRQRSDLHGGDRPVDFTNIGTKEKPTRDKVVLKKALSQIKERKSEFPTPGWVHLRYAGYKLPPSIPHPLHPKDGHRIVDMWFFINEQGQVEKTSATIADIKGNILQHSVCSEDICGNIMLAALPEYADLPFTSKNEPFPFDLNSAGTLIYEISVPNSNAVGWVEKKESDTVFYIYTEAGASEPIKRMVPDHEGSVTRMGISVSSGLLTHFSLFDKKGGALVAQYIDNLVLYEHMLENPEIDMQIKEITAALREREGK